MTRQMMKLIAATFAVVVTLSLATNVAAEKGGRRPAACANATMTLLNTVSGEQTLSAVPGDEMLSTVTVGNCSKETTTVVVEQILTDSCGYAQSMGTTTFRLRRGETRQTMMSFLAPNVECSNGVTITSKVTTQDGTLLTSPSTYLTITPAS